MYFIFPWKWGGACDPQGYRDAFGLYQDCIAPAHIWKWHLHFQPDLALVEDKMKSRVLTGVIQGTNHLSRIFSSGLYTRVQFEVWIEFVPIGAQDASLGNTCSLRSVRVPSLAWVKIKLSGEELLYF